MHDMPALKLWTVLPKDVFTEEQYLDFLLSHGINRECIETLYKIRDHRLYFSPLNKAIQTLEIFRLITMTKNVREGMLYQLFITTNGQSVLFFLDEFDKQRYSKEKRKIAESLEVKEHLKQSKNSNKRNELTKVIPDAADILKSIREKSRSDEYHSLNVLKRIREKSYSDGSYSRKKSSYDDCEDEDELYEDYEDNFYKKSLSGKLTKEEITHKLGYAKPGALDGLLPPSLPAVVVPPLPSIFLDISLNRDGLLETVRKLFFVIWYYRKNKTVREINQFNEVLISHNSKAVLQLDIVKTGKLLPKSIRGGFGTFKAKIPSLPKLEVRNPGYHITGQRPKSDRLVK